MIAARSSNENVGTDSSHNSFRILPDQNLGAQEAKTETLFSESLNCKCGAESTKGCHGVRNGQIYSEHFCDSCYNK